MSIDQKNWLCKTYTYAHTNAKFNNHPKTKQTNKQKIIKPTIMQRHNNSPTLKSNIAFNVQNIKQLKD